jgi:hypothetical protein
MHSLVLISIGPLTGRLYFLPLLGQTSISPLGSTVSDFIETVQAISYTLVLNLGTYTIYGTVEKYGAYKAAFIVLLFLPLRAECIYFFSFFLQCRTHECMPNLNVTQPVRVKPLIFSHITNIGNWIQ